MDFELRREITAKLAELDAFIEAEIAPLQREPMQFFDHRREHARTDWDNDGRPQPAWRYSRALPFEHIYRHHRRYRITEGFEEVQMRRLAQYLVGFSGKKATQ